MQRSEKECRNPCNENEKKMLCDPNASCLLKDEKFGCQCKSGYTGNGTICTDNCDNYCENKGKCKKDNAFNPYCKCVGSFTGKRCTEKSEFLFISGGITAAVLIIVVIALLVWMICAR